MKHNLGWTEWTPWRSKGETRVVASEAQWKLPLKWHRAAKAAGERHRVFCASLADVFEDWQGPMLNAVGNILFRDTSKEVPWTDGSDRKPGVYTGVTMADVRARLFRLIDDTRNLDWLLLTKRPENIARMMPWARRGETRMEPAQRKNIWLGVSVEDQVSANERIPHLLKNSAAVRFLSVEPLLGPIDLRTLSHQTKGYASFGNFWDYNCENHCSWRGFESELIADPEQSNADADRNGVRYVCPKCQSDSALIERRDDDPVINWVIIGGESGPGARPCLVKWIRDLVQQCKSAGVPVFVKQLGARPDCGPFDREEGAFPRCWNCGHYDFGPCSDGTLICNGCDSSWRGRLRDRNGADMAEWPADLRVREFPTPQRSA